MIVPLFARMRQGLSRCQLQKLSGLTQPAAVRRWLEEHGVPFMVRADGQPVTTLDAVIHRLFGAAARVTSRPDFSEPPSRRRLKKKAAAPRGTPEVNADRK